MAPGLCWDRCVSIEQSGTAQPRQTVVAAAALFVFGAALIAVGFTGLWSGGPVGAGAPTSAWWFLLPLGAACGAVVLRARLPRTALVVATAALLADLYLGSSLGTLLAFYDVLYGAAITASPRLRRVLAVCAAVGIGTPALAVLVAGGDPRVAFFIALQLFALLATPLWWASDVRRRNELLDLAAQRTADLERIHALSRDRAIADERTAMARDVHDVVASHMSAIALRSGAALAGPPDAEADRAALEAIRASALAAHADLRSMITLLRDSAPTPLEAPTLADLPALLDRAGSMGITVRLDDARDADAPALAAPTEHAAFRITQEAVMNAVQHAQGSEVAVRIDSAHSGGIDLTVRSTRTGDGVDSASSAHDGLGLLTMAERARAVGGDLRVEPTDRDWVVAAHLPAAAP